MLINVVFNFILVGILYYYNVVSLHVGLALASVGSAWLQCYWLYRKLRIEQIITQPLVSWTYLLKILAALVLMAVVILGILNVVPEWHEIRWYYRFINLFIIIGSSVFVYFGAMYLFNGFQEIKLNQSKES
jgi:putative peptidoglycan lipid II flippase